MQYVCCLCVLAGALAVRPAESQPSEWAILMHRGEALELEGRYGDAEECYAQAVQQGDKAHRAKSENELAGLHIEMGRYLDAGTEYRQALADLLAFYGTETMDYAVTLANLASLYTEEGDLAKAEKSMREAVRLEAALAPPGDIRPAMANNALAQILLHRRKYDEAERLLGGAIAVFEKAPGAWRQHAISLNNLGCTRQYQGRYEEAAVLFEKGLSILESNVGTDHPLLLRLLDNLAFSYARSGQTEKAREAFERTLALAERHSSPENPVYGSILANYAAFLRQSGDKAGAKTYAARARQSLQESERRNGAGMTVDVSAFGGR